MLLDNVPPITHTDFVVLTSVSPILVFKEMGMPSVTTGSTALVLLEQEPIIRFPFGVVSSRSPNLRRRA